MRNIISAIRSGHLPPDRELLALLACTDESTLNFLRDEACEVRHKVFGNGVYIRGLIEFSSYCKNDCLYCGLRRSNRKAERYRLSEEAILACTDAGYELGFRTFVLQGGEDGGFSDERMENLARSIKNAHPDCALTLSLGERPREVYQRLFDAGADRYLLRHETADSDHYSLLHPKELTLENRMRCLCDLKEIGYQVGCGFMVGSPHQKPEHLIKDLRFLYEFRPHMVGIGPFIPHKDTPFGNENPGSIPLTLKLLSIIRLMLPEVLLPATTALGTLSQGGREAGILAGANVIMPNLSPSDVRSKYLLYNNKLATGLEAAEALDALRQSMRAIGYEICTSRGDSPLI
ncbi:MAG: [FeFe] hydrogenase H-cluster radical SAM maturase HydE [Clostridiales bacterium]|nr:[FeFe] hydrogenase H-cluster radical SAM maturase HydE [Clostridiales bacterium]